MKLYGYPTFRSQKIAIALNELGVEHERVKIDLGRGEQKSPEFARLNPNKHVPVLEDEDLILWESNAILAYLGEREGRLWPSDAKGKGEALQWLFYCTSTLEPVAGPIWYEDVIAPRIGQEKNEALIVENMMKMGRIAALLEAHLQSNNWFLGDEYSVVDAAFGPVLGALGMSRFDLLAFPGIQAYMMLTKERPSWAEIRRF